LSCLLHLGDVLVAVVGVALALKGARVSVGGDDG